MARCGPGGANGSGQLGLGNQQYQTTPRRVGSDADWQQVWAGLDHTLALKKDGSLWAWGGNSAGQLGTDSLATQRLTPQRVGTDTWRSASAGAFFTVAVRQDGTLWAWGSNSSSQLGTSTKNLFNYVPIQVSAATNWASLSAGESYALALRTDGTLWAWGDNGSGQLGLGTIITSQPIPVRVGTAAWQSVAAGQEHTLAIRADGTLWAWGSNRDGELGLGTTTQPTSPAQVGTATTWVSISAGYNFSLGLRQDGTLWAWGNNRWGQLGLGTTTQQNSPARVGTATWASVAAGYAQVVALHPDNSCWAWGGNYIGQAGTGTGGPQLLPAQINSVPTWQAVAVSYQQALGLRTDGTLWAWGANSNGQLGTGDDPDHYLPTPVSGPATTWQSVTTAGSATLAIRTDGSLWAWGPNGSGQLGTGASLLYGTTTPVRVGTAANWRSVSASSGHVLAIRTDGTLWAWGSNSFGQLGIGTASFMPETSPVQVGTATTWQSVSASVFHSVALRTDGTLWSWGSRMNGVLGDGSSNINPQLTPAQAGTAANWASVSANVSHNLALRTDGTLWAWGENSDGKLGLASTAGYLNTPAQVGTATTWASVSAGPNGSLALRTDGTLWVWGNNSYGGLGLGAVNQQDAPVQRGSDTWLSGGLGTNYGAGIRTDGSLWTWGYNNFGQLGNGLLNLTTPGYVLNGGGAPLATSPAAPTPAWQLAPNPSHGTVQLLGLPAGLVAAQLFDNQGRLVRTVPTPTIGLEGLAPGLYLLRATAGATTRTLRLAVE
ncbi:T9SS type A sorting domain-containing protein [Hymenobacter psoromatis]|uniref:RCC1 domain-containing protein n=1 Tax=Hymenobacter psoromatis TaxID=1484116 RepID=UPI001CBAE36E|nr:T9SS type A sorting domain-containing protein [Hymenobacter psoromatis]